MTAFFSENYDAIQKFSDLIESYAGRTEDEHATVLLLRAAINAVSFNREEYDLLTPYSAERQGRSLLQAIKEPFTAEKLKTILLFFAGFIREATLVRQNRSQSEQVVLDHFLGSEISADDEWGGYHVDYLRYVLPAQLLDSNYAGIKRVRADVQKIEQDALAETRKLEERIVGYQRELKKLSSEYNFVGLSGAFRELLTVKKSERWFSFASVVLLGAAAIGVPIFFLVTSEGLALKEIIPSAWSPGAVTRLIAAAGIELIFLYFFRVALRGYLLARSQITNLQLRLSLCSFIEGYLDFAAKAAASKSTVGLSAFEGLIFGGLPSDDLALPSTFDGLEQLTKLAQAVKAN